MILFKLDNIGKVDSWLNWLIMILSIPCPKQITENVVRLDNADSASISAFFKWVSSSISISSTKVEDSGKEVTGLSELPPPPAELNIVV